MKLISLLGFLNMKVTYFTWDRGLLILFMCFRFNLVIFCFGCFSYVHSWRALKKTVELCFHSSWFTSFEVRVKNFHFNTVRYDIDSSG